MEYPAIDLTKVEPFNTSNFTAVNDTDYIQDVDNTAANNNLQTQINNNATNISTNTTLANTKLDRVNGITKRLYVENGNVGVKPDFDSFPNTFGHISANYVGNAEMNLFNDATISTDAQTAFSFYHSKNDVTKDYEQLMLLKHNGDLELPDGNIIANNITTIETNISNNTTLANTKLDSDVVQSFQNGMYVSSHNLTQTGWDTNMFGRILLPNSVNSNFNCCFGTEQGVNINDSTGGGCYFGRQAGKNNVGSFCSFFGHQSDSDGGDYNRSTAIGASATITASDQIMLGTNSQIVVCPGTLSNPKFNKMNKAITAPTLSAVSNGNDNVFLSLGSLNLPETGRFQISCSVIFTINTAMTLESYAYGLGNNGSSLNGNTKLIQYNNSALVINNVIREQMVLIIDNTDNTDYHLNGKMSYNGSTNGYTLSVSNLLITQLF